MRRTLERGSKDLEIESIDHLGSLQVMHKRWQERLVYSEAEMHPGLTDLRCWVVT